MTHQGHAAIRVLHVSHTGEGGVGKCAGDFVADQCGRGWSVTVATEPDTELRERALVAGAKAVPWEATRHPTIRLPAEILGLRTILAAARPDVVHLHSSKAGLCGRLLLRGRMPTIFQPHGWSFEAADGMLRRLVVGWERFAARWAHALVSVSEAERERGLRNGIEARYRVIPNGVDVDRFAHADRGDAQEARRRLDLDGRPLVVCVGRLSRAKGQDILVSAWPAVVAQVPNAELALVGDGEDLERLRAHAASSIHFVGHRGDVPEWLAAADLVAVPSRWEGMSLGMLEAMATGRSIVMTDVPGAREALDGAGAIVPPRTRAPSRQRSQSAYSTPTAANGKAPPRPTVPGEATTCARRSRASPRSARS